MDYLSRVEAVGLTPEQNDVLARYRNVGETVVGPASKLVDQDRCFPTAAVEAIRAAGLTGLCVPKRYGGLGAGENGDNVLLIAATMELASWCSSTSQIMSAHNACIELISAIGSEEQKRYFFAEALAGNLFATFGAEANSNRFIIGSRVTPDGSDFRLSGRKHFATSSTGAKWALWVAVTEEGRLLLPIVRLESEGIVVIDNWDGIGQRGTGSGTVTAEDVPIPEMNMLNADHPNYRDTATTKGNLQFSAQFTGMAIGAYRSALGYVASKSRPWKDVEHPANDPFIQLRVADMSVSIQAARALVLQTARLLQEHADDRTMDNLVAVGVSHAKVLATEVALNVTSQVFQVMGASSAVAANGFDRFYRNARTLTLHDPIDRRRELIGMHELGVLEKDALAIVASGHAGAAALTNALERVPEETRRQLDEERIAIMDNPR